MSITKKLNYAKTETPKPVVSRYLKNSTGSCHDRCKHTTTTTGPQTKLIHSTTHKVGKISIFKRLYDRKFRVPTTTAAADTVKKSPDKYLYILPSSSGAKSVVGPIKQKGNSSPWLPSSCSVKKCCPKKDTNTIMPPKLLVPSPMVEKSRRRAEIRAATIVPDSSSLNNIVENALTTTRKGDAAKLEQEKIRQLFKRSGKVVEPRVDCNIMWRLKFRKSRLLDDRQCGGDIGRRSYKKVESGSTAQKGSKSDKLVVLRHCESENVGKHQSLLNSVIEQTASKLAESRKSKVKALVGAFETVISLQHPKSRKHVD